MSGFPYHVACARCGATTGTCDLWFHTWDNEVFLPAYNVAGRTLETAIIEQTAENTKLFAARSLDELARLHTTAERLISAPRNGLELDPALPCGCGATIERVTWGSAPRRPGVLATIDEIIAATRTPDDDDLRFTSTDSRYDVDCDTYDDERRWSVRLRGELRDRSAELRAIAEELVARLTRTGVTIERLDIRSHTARFRERR